MRVFIHEDESVKGRMPKMQVNVEEFEKVLREWGFSDEFFEKTVIIFDIRDMIPTAAYGGRNGHVFLIYLCLSLFTRENGELNSSVAHELKHLWYQASGRFPPVEEVLNNGFLVKSRRYKWEERECARVEKKYAAAPFIVVQGAAGPK